MRVIAVSKQAFWWSVPEMNSVKTYKTYEVDCTVIDLVILGNYRQVLWQVTKVTTRHMRSSDSTSNVDIWSVTR